MSRNFDLSQAANDGVTILPDLTTITPTKGDVLVAGTIASGQVFLEFTTPVWAGSYLSTTGGTMTGPIVLPGDPTLPLQATTKQYADSKNASQNLLIGQAQATADNAVKRIGDTMTGALTLPFDPVAPLQAATKSYVDTKISSIPTSITVADTPPALTNGALWFCSTDTQLYVGYVDPTGPGQWVVANNTGMSGSYLPLSGGTVTGPLNWTSTGSTTSRAAQDRTADVANVRDFGAVVSGGAIDSTAAFRAALATGKDVYFPGGPYTISGKLTVSGSQQLFGDNRAKSVLLIFATTFNMADTAVIQMSGDAMGARLHDFTIQFNATDTSDRASIPHFPPAIATTGGRNNIERIQIAGPAYVGIDVTTQAPSGNSVIWASDLEVCALYKGLIIDGSQDWVSVVNYEFWVFGLSAYPGFNAVYHDQTVIGIELGNTDGFDAHGIKLLDAKLKLTSAASGGWFSIANLGLDGPGAELWVDNAQWLQITNMYKSGGTTGSAPAITVNGGLVRITHIDTVLNGASPVFINQTGGTLTFLGGEIRPTNTSVSCATVSGGTLRMIGTVIHPGVDAAFSQPMLAQTGAGALSLMEVLIAGGASSGVAVSSANAGSVIHNLTLGSGWTMAIAPGNYAHWLKGTYGNQFVVGQTGQGGRVDFSRGVDGAAAGWIGMDVATGTSDMRLKAVPGNSKVILDHATGGVLSFCTGGTQYGTSTYTYGNQMKLGYTGQGGRVDFARGSDGGFTGFVGMSAITGTPVMLANTGGSPFVIIDAQNSSGTVSLRTNSIERFGVTDTAATLSVPWSSGTSYGALVGASSSDTSKHITLHTSGFGFGITSARMNLITTGTSTVNCVIGGNDRLSVSDTAVTVNSAALTINPSGPTIRSGTGAATGTQPAGSLFLRTDGATGSRLYVSAGGGTWAAVAGV